MNSYLKNDMRQKQIKTLLWFTRGSSLTKKGNFLLALLAVILSFLALIRPYFHEGVPYTHDGENHLARFANYKIALKEGQLPPRFAPNLMNHYGYPVFNYNYPLANIFSLPFSAFGISYEATFKKLMVLGLLVGTGGIVTWLRVLKLTQKTLLLWTLIPFFLSPFLINLIYVRGGVGEVWALAFFPWLLWLSHQIKDTATKSASEKKSLVLPAVCITTSFFLAHNISTLFGGIIWVIYTVFLFGKNRQAWFSWGGYSFLGFCLSAWFWLPAFFEKNQIILESANLSSQFAHHFVSLSQIIYSPLQFGYSYNSPVDTMSFSLGLSLIFSLVFCVIMVLKKHALSLLPKSLLGFLVCFTVILIFLQTSHSLFVWKAFPLLHFIQFPWRLALFVTILTLPLFVVSFSFHPLLRKILVGFLCIQYLMLLRFQPADFIHKSNLDYDLFSQSTSTAHENLPKTFQYEHISDWSPAPRIITGQADVTVTHWTGSKRIYEVDVQEKTLLAEPTAYFLGWETTANGNHISYADMSETEGRIGYWLEPGQYTIVSRFTQNTYPRRIGNTLSVVALIWVLWKAGKEWKKSQA